MKLETPEEQRFWLATYEAERARGRTLSEATEDADLYLRMVWHSRQGPAVAPQADVKQAEEFIARLTRELDGARAESEGRRRLVELARQEIAQLQTERGEALRGRDKARALLDAVRTALKASRVPDGGLPVVVAGMVAANEDLRGARDVWVHERDTHFEDKKRLIKERDDWRRELEAVHRELEPNGRPYINAALQVKGLMVDRAAIVEALPPGDGGAAERVKALAADRNGLQEDLAAMKGRLRSLEDSSAACHQDLAAVRVALGVHNNPERTAAECVGAVVRELGVLQTAWVVCSGCGYLNKPPSHRRQS